MIGKVIARPEPQQFARVDEVKRSVGQDPLEGDDRLWILGASLVVEMEPGGWLTVPEGFVTDGASIPGLAQALTGWKPWDEPQRWAAIFHDWAYCLNGSDAVAGRRCGKPYADQAFRAILRSEGASALRSEAMYLAVHLFGGSAYEADQEHGPDIWPGNGFVWSGRIAHEREGGS